MTWEAGLGETRLTVFAAEVFSAGALVLYGRCDEELAVPYLPWIESLGHYLEHVADDDLSTIDGATAAQLAHLLPALRKRLADRAASLAAEARDAVDRFGIGALRGKLQELDG